MKNRLKIFAIITLMIVSFVMIACDTLSIDQSSNNTNKGYSTTNNVSNNNETQVSQINEEKYYIDLYDMDEDLLNEIISKKNDDVEIPYNENGYSTEELDTLILSTNVKIRSYDIDNPKNTWKTISGNIYDIDDEYIYILTCGHSFVRNSQDYGKIGFEDVIKELKITFITGEEINANPEFIYIHSEIDVALILLNKNLVSKNTLSTIRTINIDNIYRKNLTNNVVYEYSYNSQQKTYVKYYAKIIGISYDKLEITSDIINGCSGGGFFDTNGTYCGMVHNKGFMLFNKVITSFYELIKIANPNY